MGDKPPLVLIHCPPFSSQARLRLAPLLARHWTGFFFDFLVCGASGMWESDVSIGVQNRRFACLLATWEIERLDVLAHEVSGTSALRGFLLDEPRFRSLKLLDAVALAPWGSLLVTHMSRHDAAFAGLLPLTHDARLPPWHGASAVTGDALTIYMVPWRG